MGDVHFPQVREVASALTPVPGGVGPLTIALLMKNTVAAARGEPEAGVACCASGSREASPAGSPRWSRRLAAAGLPTLDLDRVAHEVDGPRRRRVRGGGRGLRPRHPRPRRRPSTAAPSAPIVFARPLARAAAQRASCIRASGPRRRRRAACSATAGRRAGHRRGAPRRDRDPPALRPPGGRPLPARPAAGAPAGPRRPRRGGGRARLAAQMPIAAKRPLRATSLSTPPAPSRRRHRAADALARRARGARPAFGPGRSRSSEARRAACLVHGPAEGPRGLTPARVHEQIALAGGLGLEALAGQLRPAAPGPGTPRRTPPRRIDAGPGPRPPRSWDRSCFTSSASTASTPSASRRPRTRWPGSRTAQAIAIAAAVLHALVARSRCLRLSALGGRARRCARARSRPGRWTPAVGRLGPSRGVEPVLAAVGRPRDAAGSRQPRRRGGADRATWPGRWRASGG